MLINHAGHDMRGDAATVHMLDDIPTVLSKCVGIDFRNLCNHTLVSILEFFQLQYERLPMRSIIYIVGLVVVVIAVLSFFGMR